MRMIRNYITKIIQKAKKEINYKTVAIFTGATGGHIFPAISVAEELLNNDYIVHFFIDKSRGYKLIQNNNIINKENFYLHLLSIENRKKRINKYKTLAIQFFQILKDLVLIIKLILSNKVSLCLCFGGYVSFSGVLSGILTFRKIVLHEQNKVLSVVNKFGIHFANICCTAFDDTINVPEKQKYKCIQTGNPLRREILDLCYQNDNTAIKYSSLFKIYDKINILVTGGSQGARILTNTIAEAIILLPASIKNKILVSHQCPEIDSIDLKYIYDCNQINANVREFFHNIPDLMSSAHVVISRSGYSISEILALGAPSILIPMAKSKNNHQYYNAKHMLESGSAIMIEEKDLNSAKISNVLLNLLSQEYLLFELSKNAKKNAILDAHITIVHIINQILSKNKKRNVATFDTKNEMINKIRTISNNVGLG